MEMDTSEPVPGPSSAADLTPKPEPIRDTLEPIASTSNFALEPKPGPSTSRDEPQPEPVPSTSKAGAEPQPGPSTSRNYEEFEMDTSSSSNFFQTDDGEDDDEPVKSDDEKDKDWSVTTATDDEDDDFLDDTLSEKSKTEEIKIEDEVLTFFNESASENKSAENEASSEKPQEDVEASPPKKPLITLARTYQKIPLPMDPGKNPSPGKKFRQKIASGASPTYISPKPIASLLANPPVAYTSPPIDQQTNESPTITLVGPNSATGIATESNYLTILDSSKQPAKKRKRKDSLSQSDKAANEEIMEQEIGPNIIVQQGESADESGQQYLINCTDSAYNQYFSQDENISSLEMQEPESSDDKPTCFKVTFPGTDIFPEHTLKAPTLEELESKMRQKMAILEQERKEQIMRAKNSTGRQCQACQVVFATYGSYIFHIRYCPLLCNRCGLSFNYVGQFSKHQHLCKPPKGVKTSASLVKTQKERQCVNHNSKNHGKCNCVMCG